MQAMQSVTTVTSKGQVTLPKFMRHALELNAGSKLSFVLQGDSIILTRVEDAPHHDESIVSFLHLMEQDIAYGRNIMNLPVELFAAMQSSCMECTQDAVEYMKIEGEVVL